MNLKEKQDKAFIMVGSSLKLLQCECCFQGPPLNEFIMYIVVIDRCDCPRMTLFGILSKIDGTLSMEKINKCPLN